jgi:hypothetical protein
MRITEDDQFLVAMQGDLEHLVRDSETGVVRSASRCAIGTVIREALSGAIPGIREHLAGFLGGVIALDDFYRWAWDNAGAIEELGSDEDVALLNLVLHRFAEYTSGHINAAELLDALRTDPLVRKELPVLRTAVA